MTRAANQKQRRRQSRASRVLLLLAAIGAAAVVAAGALLLNGSDSDGEQVFGGVPTADPGPIHVHGLGINPSDGSLFIATHTGLFRVGKDSETAVRVGDRLQDTMGFSVAGPNRFLGSGHPDARERALPPLLGLIESVDAGRTWEPISLLGEADFHVLRSAGTRVYGYDASNDRLLASADRGRSWRELDKPGPIVDLAPDPGDPRRLVVAAAGDVDGGLYESLDAGTTWRRLSDAVGLIAWPARGRFYVIDGQGQVFVSSEGGRRLMAQGEIGGEPAALLGQGPNELYVALHDGTIKRTTDGGATWVVRSAPS